jgi:hypothetical protein
MAWIVNRATANAKGNAVRVEMVDLWSAGPCRRTPQIQSRRAPTSYDSRHPNRLASMGRAAVGRGPLRPGRGQGRIRAYLRTDNASLMFNRQRIA